MQHSLLIGVLSLFTTCFHVKKKSLSDFNYRFIIYRPNQGLVPQAAVYSDAWRAKSLLFRPTTLPDIESKADRQVYKSAVQFRVDSATIVHNVAIFHGGYLKYLFKYYFF